MKWKVSGKKIYIHFGRMKLHIVYEQSSLFEFYCLGFVAMFQNGLHHIISPGLKPMISSEGMPTGITKA